MHLCFQPSQLKKWLGNIQIDQNKGSCQTNENGLIYVDQNRLTQGQFLAPQIL